jgi:tetratricopeptide (TPR) repeat protein
LLIPYLINWVLIHLPLYHLLHLAGPGVEDLRQDPENTDLLYNLGLCYVDLGQLDQGRELLHRCLELAHGHSHACTALALGYQRAGDLLRAKEYTMQALAADPGNPVALKNLGAILGKEGDSLRALYYLRRSYECDPLDPQTVYGLAFAYMELGDIELAQKHFQKVLEMEAPEELRGLARDGLSKIAARELKARGPRKDDGLLSRGALRLFRGKSLQESF